MVYYEDDVLKAFKKCQIPKQVFRHLNNAFISIDRTHDLNLFDVKKLKTGSEKNRNYYRLRKSKYRAIFFIENSNIYVIKIGSRGEVYNKWE
jgi:mRNA interferase RelE/StbE